jgi:hypothetical protein
MLLPWFKALVLTLAIECPVAALLLKAQGVSRVRLIVLLFFANLATHPVVWFVFPELPWRPWLSFALSEAFAVLAEGVFFIAALRVRPTRAMAASLAANGLSLSVGLLLYRFGML